MIERKSIYCSFYCAVADAGLNPSAYRHCCQFIRHTA